jgi:hypothetical protein
MNDNANAQNTIDAKLQYFYSLHLYSVHQKFEISNNFNDRKEYDFDGFNQWRKKKKKSCSNK